MYQLQGLFGAVMPLGTAPLTEEDLDAGAASHGEILIMKRCQIKRVMFLVTEAVVATSVAPVVVFRKRPTPLSSSDQSTIGTLTIPDTTAVGKIIYADVTPVVLDAGDSILLDNTVAGSGGSTAGKGIYGFELDMSPEVPANQSDMVASA